MAEAAADDAVGASNRFGMALYQRLRSSKGNLAFSPASISMALAMTYGGAEGRTAAEMKRTLAFPDGEEALHGGWADVVARWQRVDDLEVAVANRLFGDRGYTFEPSFLELTKSRYGAPLEPVDFAGAPQVQRTRINDWVAEQTKDRIEDLVPAAGVTPQTRLALVNALYFKAAWAEPFPERRTQTAPFAAPGGPVDVPMMAFTGSMEFAEVDGVKLAQRRYDNRDFAALFALPPEGTDLASLEAELDAPLLERWSEALTRERVIMNLPRFELEPSGSIALKEHLVAMGMPTAFGPGADFTGIADPKNATDQLRIEEVFHKAFVAMDEKGTEAAAATAVMMGRKGIAPGKPKEFRADRPFLFFVRDLATGLVMFAGRVSDPSR